MTDPYDPPRPRDRAIEQELESLREQEREGHARPTSSAEPSNSSAGCTPTSTRPRSASAVSTTATRTIRKNTPGIAVELAAAQLCLRGSARPAHGGAASSAPPTLAASLPSRPLS